MNRYLGVMASASARAFLLLAILISGLLAGGNIDRAIVAMPAWHEVGANSWAEFSRHADLGDGIILYPLEAIGGALLTLAAAVAFHLDRNTPREAAILLYAAVLLSASGLVLTMKAAPIMLGIRDVSEPASLRLAFEGFWYWGNLRAVFQVLAFLAQLAALAVLWRRGESLHG
jgi:hypothetical protein